MKGTVLVRWEEGYDEAINVVTDLLPNQAEAAWYQMRFWIEEDYKDGKRGWFHWEHSKMTKPERVSRLWLVLSLALSKAILVGSELEAQAQREHKHSGKRQRRRGRPLTPLTRPRGREQSVLMRGVLAIRAAESGGSIFCRKDIWWPNLCHPTCIRSPGPLGVIISKSRAEKKKSATSNVRRPDQKEANGQRREQSGGSRATNSASSERPHRQQPGPVGRRNWCSGRPNGQRTWPVGRRNRCNRRLNGQRLKQTGISAVRHPFRPALSRWMETGRPKRTWIASSHLFLPSYQTRSSSTRLLTFVQNLYRFFLETSAPSFGFLVGVSSGLPGSSIQKIDTKQIMDPLRKRAHEKTYP